MVYVPVSFTNENQLQAVNIFSRAEVHLPRTFQSRAVQEWIANLRFPIILEQHRYIASLISGLRSEDVGMEDVGRHNSAPMIQSFLTPPDRILGWMAQKWTAWEHVLIAAISIFTEELTEKYKALAELADR